MTRKIVIFGFITLLVIAFFLSPKLKGGGQSSAEMYDYIYSYSTLKQDISLLKKNDSSFSLPKLYSAINGSPIPPNDPIYKDPSISCDYYFYDKKEDNIMFFEVQIRDTCSGIFFIGINHGNKLGYWKDINKDFSKEENKEVMNRFEELVINKLPVKYKKKYNVNSLWEIFFN